MCGYDVVCVEGYGYVVVEFGVYFECWWFFWDVGNGDFVVCLLLLLLFVDCCGY